MDPASSALYKHARARVYAKITHAAIRKYVQITRIRRPENRKINGGNNTQILRALDSVRSFAPSAIVVWATTTNNNNNILLSGARALHAVVRYCYVIIENLSVGRFASVAYTICYHRYYVMVFTAGLTSSYRLQRARVRVFSRLAFTRGSPTTPPPWFSHPRTVVQNCSLRISVYPVRRFEKSPIAHGDERCAAAVTVQAFPSSRGTRVRTYRTTCLSVRQTAWTITAHFDVRSGPRRDLRLDVITVSNNSVFA